METLLKRLKPEFKLQLETMEHSQNVIDILDCQFSWTKLEFQQVIKLMIYFDLSSLDKVVYLFD
jgi:hypothetical protein